MFCSKCGAVIDDDMDFCSNCGANVRENENSSDISGKFVQEASNQTELPNYQNNTVVNEKKPRKPINKKLLIVIGVVIVILAVLIGVISFKSSRVSVDKYISADGFEVEGFDGYGTIVSSAESVIDYEGLQKALGLLSSDSVDSYDYDDWEGYDWSDTEVSDCFEASFKQNYENISNGDVIEIEVTVDYTEAANLGSSKKLVGDDTITVSYTVSNLKEVTSIDPFSLIKNVYVDPTTDYVSLCFEYNDEDSFSDLGYSANKTDSGYCEYSSAVDNSDEDSDDDSYYYSEDVYFSFDFETDAILDNAKSGDTIKLVVQSDYDLGSMGIEFSTTEKEFTVDMLTLVDDTSVITAEIVTQMKEKVEDETQSVVASQYFYYYADWDEEDQTFKGVYFLVKSESGYSVYYYSNECIKISDSGNVIVNFDSLSNSYSGYSKIKDFEESCTSDSSHLSKIKLS